MKLFNPIKLFLIVTSYLLTPNFIISQNTNNPKIAKEKDGFVLVEAEDFTSQSKSETRKCYVTSLTQNQSAGMDPDESHASTASGNAYIEILPDIRTNHDEKLIPEENFTDKPGAVAVVSYKVNFQKTGRYYIWAKVFSTGSEDNGVHVGIDGQWPESGKRMQWCEGKKTWFWDSKQRTKEKHCGLPFQSYLDIDKVGIHKVQFSMREDGFEMDQWILTNDKDFNPRNNPTF
jgi:hypothetical protein